MAWQAELEANRQLMTLDRYELGDAAITIDDVLTRFEIFWSRLSVAQHGTEGKLLLTVPGASDLISNVIGKLPALEAAKVNSFQNKTIRRSSSCREGCSWMYSVFASRISRKRLDEVVGQSVP